MTKNFLTVRQEAESMHEAIRLVLEASAPGLQHYASGIDAESKDGKFSSADQKSLKSAGAKAKAAGMTVSYSTAGKNRSAALNSKHDMVHISGKDEDAVHKILTTTGHSQDKETTEFLKSKTHGGHSKATSEYHDNVGKAS